MKEDQTETLELKNTGNGMKNATKTANSRHSPADERTWEFKDDLR